MQKKKEKQASGQGYGMDISHRGLDLYPKGFQSCLRRLPFWSHWMCSDCSAPAAMGHSHIPSDLTKSSTSSYGRKIQKNYIPRSNSLNFAVDVWNPWKLNFFIIFLKGHTMVKGCAIMQNKTQWFSSTLTGVRGNNWSAHICKIWKWNAWEPSALA